MSVASNAILRVVAQSVFPDSVLAQNVFYVLFANDGTSNDDDDVLDDLEAWIEDMFTNLAAYISTSVSADQMWAYYRDTVGGDWDEIGDRTWAVTFTENSTNMLPHGIAALVHMKTSNPDVQGSKFIGGITEASTIDSDLQAGLLTALALFVTDWITPFTGSSTGSTFTPGVWSPTDEAFYSAGSVGEVKTLASYQRRRKPGVGI